MVDEGTRTTLSNIPLLKTRAGPRDKELWVQRLKEEYQAMIKVTKLICPFNRIQSLTVCGFSTSKTTKTLDRIGSV